MGRRKNFFFVFQAFIIGLVLVIITGLTRGIIYEEELARAQYIPGISVIGISLNEVFGNIAPLDLDFINEIRQNGGMLTEYFAANWSNSYDYLGTFPEYLETFNPSLRAGRYFTADEKDSNLCLVSENVAKTLFGTINNSIGKIVTLDSLATSFEIVGVIEDNQPLPVQTVDIHGREQPKFNVSSNRFLIYPVSGYQMPKDFVGIYRSIWVDGNVLDATRLVNYLDKLNVDLAYIVNPLPLQIINNNETQNLLVTLLVGFAFLVFFVAALGMFGMQMISVLRQKKELGLRVAVGAKQKDILQQILLESAKTLLIPGAVGIGVGYLLHPLLSKLLALPMLFDGILVVISFVVLTVFAVLVGLYPAWKGANMDPIECLGKTPRLN